MKVPFLNLKLQWINEKKHLLPIIDKVIKSGFHVGGSEIEKFENSIAKLTKTKYCVALNSGTDALILAMHAIGIRKGDEVITTPNSFIASTASIVHLGAKPIFVDVQADQNINPNLIEKHISKKTKAIMPVHLTGRISEMKKICQISKKYKIPIIEDAAQSIGSKYYEKLSGTFGKIGCFSAHPLKNLNAIGDSGYLVSNEKNLCDRIKSFRNHGILEREKPIMNFGAVSRMDNLQAAILNYRLLNLNKVILQRRKNVEIYKKNLNLENVFIPKEKNYEFNTYHTFVIQVKNRDKLKKFLLKNNVSTAIHYPVPTHLQPASKYLGYKKGSFKVAEKQSKTILSIPINQFLKKEQILCVCNLINKFYKK